MEAYYMSELKVKDDAIKLKEKQISKLRAEI